MGMGFLSGSDKIDSGDGCTTLNILIASEFYTLNG